MWKRHKYWRQRKIKEVLVLGNLSAKLNTSVCDIKLWSSGNVFVCRKAVILSDLEVSSSVSSRVTNRTKQSGLSLTGHKKAGKAGQSLETDAQAPLCILFTYILNGKLYSCRACRHSVFAKELYQQCFVHIQFRLGGMPLSRYKRLLNCKEPSLRKRWNDSETLW